MRGAAGNCRPYRDHCAQQEQYHIGEAMRLGCFYYRLELAQVDAVEAVGKIDLEGAKRFKS